MLTLEDVIMRDGKRDATAVEQVNNKEVALHVIRMPGICEKRGYTSAISVCYFRKREMNSWHDKYYTKRKVCPRWFSVHHGFENAAVEAIRQEESLAAMNISFVHPLRNVPIHEHESLWDFYKFIGYDYKKQKYTNVIT